ncbi:MFS transporter [Levilactobacillus suantsaiihabitans]|uniref:MFS transporter n=1 Tax=Levilactobacillus suantsaiihabitans TaxID=2487722 RepID=UPI001436A5A9|nr:MFS transporter [Levilactobacillus suantsaiihabitans]
MVKQKKVIVVLHQSDFRNIFIGRSISNAGDSVYGIALGWYFIQFKAGTILLGILEYCPVCFCLFSGGTLIDTPKRRF